MNWEVLAMSGAERERVDVLGRLMRGELRQARAAELLGIGVRQVKRLVCVRPGRIEIERVSICTTSPGFSKATCLGLRTA